MHYFVQGLGLGLGLGILVSVSVSVSNCKSLGLEGMVSVSKELVSVLVSVSNVLVSVSVSDIKVSTTTLLQPWSLLPRRLRYFKNQTIENHYNQIQLSVGAAMSVIKRYVTYLALCHQGIM